MAVEKVEHKFEVDVDAPHSVELFPGQIITVFALDKEGVQGLLVIEQTTYRNEVCQEVSLPERKIEILPPQPDPNRPMDESTARYATCRQEINGTTIIFTFQRKPPRATIHSRW